MNEFEDVPATRPYVASSQPPLPDFSNIVNGWEGPVGNDPEFDVIMYFANGGFRDSTGGSTTRAKGPGAN